MNIQVLCTTMNQETALPLCNKMNIQSDVIFANQCDKVYFEETNYGDYIVKMIATNTVGVGINRNMALMYANADICLLADDDLRYVDGYVQIVEDAFQKLPDADAIIFNIETVGANVKRRINSKIKRVRFFNCLNYGTPRIAFRTKSIMRENIMFSRCFGGGTAFSAGEDSLFITDMLRKKIKIYTYPKKIAEVDQRSSTWFTGYNKKLLYDRGVLYAALSLKLSKLLCIQALIRHKELYVHSKMNFLEAYQIMKNGIKGYSDLISFSSLEKCCYSKEKTL